MNVEQEAAGEHVAVRADEDEARSETTENTEDSFHLREEARDSFFVPPLDLSSLNLGN